MILQIPIVRLVQVHVVNALVLQHSAQLAYQVIIYLGLIVLFVLFNVPLVQHCLLIVEVAKVIEVLAQMLLVFQRVHVLMV